MKKTSTPHALPAEKLLFLYRLSGVGAMVSFALFLILLAAVLHRPDVSYTLLALSLAAGFLWIGSTSLCRHSLVRLKELLGKRMGLAEFLSTQFVFVLLPYAYPKVKREVKRYTEKSSKASAVRNEEVPLS